MPMKIHILTNALDAADAVSTHCILLKQRAAELGIPAAIYAEFSHGDVREHVTPLDRLLESAAPDDVLLHQFFNATTLLPMVERFPGRRILMYHNITPPRFFEKGSPVYLSCLRGLRQLRTLTRAYEYAVGMSEASRRDLEGMGFPHTGVFPLFLDLEGLAARKPHPVLAGRPKPAGAVFLSVGRLAPNKCAADLIRFLAAYRRRDPSATLLLAGNDAQHPDYVQALRRLAEDLKLRAGEDVLFTGKIPESHLVAYYRSADAFLSMSEHEGFCAPLLEAMLFDLPVFAYAEPACAQTLGGAGVLFREKNFEALADTVAALLGDPARKRAVIEGQRRRLEDFTPARQRRALAGLLDRPHPAERSTRPDPRVSVVINTYNRARQLERCLATLKEQTYRNFEVVVVNGPSTDRTAEVLARHGGKLQTMETPSRVLSVSRNEGIARARGELVAFIDDDAVAHPRWLEELVPAFDDPATGAAGGLVYRMNGRDVEFRNGIIDREGFVLWHQPAPGLHWDWEEGFLNTVSGNNCMFRRAALEKIGGFDERIEYYHDEADVVLRLEQAGFRTVHRPEAVVYHESAASLNRKNGFELNWFAIAKNTVYCALKNYTGPFAGWRIALRVVRRVVRERAVPMVAWLRGGKISLPAWLRMEAACAGGIAAGLWQALRAAPLHRRFDPAPDAAGFVAYPPSAAKQLSVCLLSQSLPEESPGGIASYTAALARGLRDLGCEVHLVSRSPSLRSEFKDGIWHHHTVALPLPGEIADPRRFPTLAKNLTYSNGVRSKVLDIEARWGLDLVESPNWDAEGLLALMEHRLPSVVRAHSPLFEVCETQGWEMNADLRACSALEGVLLRHAGAVSGSTSALLELVDREFGVRSKQTLIPLGLDTAAADGTRSNHRKTILFVGRLERRKGIHTLLEAIPAVLNSEPEACLEIVGRDCGAAEDRAWKEEWERRARDSYGGRVRFHGEVPASELARWYEDCDIFVAPSLYESFGLIYLEAMARAKPVIACRAGGTPEVVADGETGLLVPPGDAAALAGAMLRLLRDDSLCRRLGEAGRERYLREFSARIMAARTLDLYQRVSRSWLHQAATAWRAGALDFLRDPRCAAAWIPETGRICALAPAGHAGVVVYGPYIRLEPGAYRAEFKLWLGAVPPPHGRLASVDVFSMKGGFAQERIVWSEDFAAGPGFVFDVFFEVPDPPPEDYEFRVHSTGCVPVYVREIVVRRWPHPWLRAALGVARASPEERND